MKDRTVIRVLALLALTGAVLVGIAAYALRNVNRAMAASDWVNATNAVINELTSLGASLQAGDASTRLYALSGGPQDLAAAREAYAEAVDHLEVVKALTREEPARQQQALRIEALANARAEFARKVMAARLAGKGEDSAALVAADNAGPGLAEARREIERLKMDSMNLLAERDKAAYLQAQATRWTVWTGVAVNFTLLGVAAWMVFSDIRFRRQAAAALEAANAQLEERVRARTAELTAANHQLSLENLERRWNSQALEHQLRYNQLIIDSISDLVLVITKAANITRLNPALSHESGWYTPDLVGHPLGEIVRFAPGAAGADPVSGALYEGRELRDLPATLRDRSGGEHPVRLSFFPLRDANKIVGGVVVMQVRPAEPTSTP